MSFELTQMARRTAVGCALFAARGDEANASVTIGIYVADALELGYTPCEAFSSLSYASLGLCAHLAGDQAPEVLGSLASRLAEGVS